LLLPLHVYGLPLPRLLPLVVRLVRWVLYLVDCIHTLVLQLITYTFAHMRSATRSVCGLRVVLRSLLPSRLRFPFIYGWFTFGCVYLHVSRLTPGFHRLRCHAPRSAPRTHVAVYTRCVYRIYAHIFTARFCSSVPLRSHVVDFVYPFGRFLYRRCLGSVYHAFCSVRVPFLWIAFTVYYVPPRLVYTTITWFGLLLPFQG